MLQFPPYFQWYESNEVEGCPEYGNNFDGGSGTANEACCWCGGGSGSVTSTSFPSSSPTVVASSSPTACDNCSCISEIMQCNETVECRYHPIKSECVVAPSTDECSEFRKIRTCLRNACRFKKRSCVGWWA